MRASESMGCVASKPVPSDSAVSPAGEPEATPARAPPEYAALAKNTRFSPTEVVSLMCLFE